jgi:hypothetical protein
MRPGTIRKIVSFDQQIALRPLAQNALGSFCCVCRGPVDSELIEEEFRGLTKNGVRIRAKCHGKEEIVAFEFGSMDWDEHDVKRAMQRIAWFHPSHQEVGGIVNGGRI